MPPLPPILSPQLLKSALVQTRKSRVPGAAAALAHTLLALALFAFGLVLTHLPLHPALAWPIAILSLSSGMLLLQLLVHECAHRAFLPWRWLNTPLGCVAGLLCFTPFFSYRRGHMAHHRWIGSSQGGDPTPSPKDSVAPNRALDVLIKFPLLPVLYWAGVYGPYLLYDVKPTAHPRRLSHVLVYIGNIAAILGLHAVLVTSLGVWPVLPWLLAGFLGSGILYENLFTLNQHIGLGAVPPGKRRYTYREQVHFSRSVRLPLAPLLMYFNLHKEHHLAPGLNYQYLPHLHRVLLERCPDIYNFTDSDPGIVRRRRLRAHELLSPNAGDT